MYNRPPRMPEFLAVFTRNGIGKKWQLLLLKKEIPAKPGTSISAELTSRWIRQRGGFRRSSNRNAFLPEQMLA
jgi:hypothetical protein